jgi:surface protein
MKIKNLLRKLAGEIPVTEEELRFLAKNYEYFNLEKLDTSNVTNMSRLFANAYSFDQNIKNWDVSNVTDMSGMFSYASAFNGEICEWDVSNVKNMNHMFLCASLFNKNLSEWNVSKVTKRIFIFEDAYKMEDKNKPKFK